MTITNLKKVIQQAQSNRSAVVGFVVQGWEDARVFVKAGSELNKPVVLQAGPGCRENTPLPVLAKMFRVLGENSDYDVVPHLDHALDIETCHRALDEGFTSVMFDGSELNLKENIKQTYAVRKLAEQYNSSVEAEIGFVGYSKHTKNKPTNPEEAAKLVAETNIDALAVSIGNTHLQLKKNTVIDYSLLMKINKMTPIPLVVHGASGISREDKMKMKKFFGVKKFNIGTELRQKFGKSLRKTLEKNKTEFDRIKILCSVEKELLIDAKKILEEIS